jgi:hypothetical protein
MKLFLQNVGWGEGLPRPVDRIKRNYELVHISSFYCYFTTDSPDYIYPTSGIMFHSHLVSVYSSSSGVWLVKLPHTFL